MSEWEKVYVCPDCKNHATRYEIVIDGVCCFCGKDFNFPTTDMEWYARIGRRVSSYKDIPDALWWKFWLTPDTIQWGV